MIDADVAKVREFARAGEPEKAVRFLGALRRAGRLSRHESLVERARIHNGAGEYEEEIAIYSGFAADPDSPFEHWFHAGRIALHVGDAGLAARLFRRAPDPRIAAMDDEGAAASPAVVGGRIADAVASWEKGETAPPPCRDLYVREEPDAGRKILIVGPRHVRNSPANVEADLTYHFFHSATECGLAAAVFHSDRITYPGFNPDLSEAEAKAGREDLMAMIEEQAPDAILQDGNYIGNQRTLNEGFWKDIKKRYRFELITYVPDSYRGALRDYAGYWAASSDRVLCLNHRSDVARRSVPREKLVFGYLPMCRRLFHMEEGTQDIDLLFCGTPSGMRPAWLALALDAGLPIHLLIDDKTAGRAPDTEAFAAICRDSKMTINFGSRGEASIVTGRVWEAVRGGSVLLEEAGSPTEDLFVPYLHYVPFASIGELAAAFRFLIDQPTARQAMRRRAHQWDAENFRNEWFWRTVLG